jgi:hypothetical protein
VKSGKRNAIFNVSPTCLPNGQGSARCSAFRRIDSAFEPSLYQRQSPPSGNAILRGRDKGPETVPAIQSADCRDKMGAQIAASSGRFALNREILVCAGLRGGVGRTRNSHQSRTNRSITSRFHELGGRYHLTALLADRSRQSSRPAPKSACPLPRRKGRLLSCGLRRSKLSSATRICPA